MDWTLIGLIAFVFLYVFPCIGVLYVELKQIVSGIKDDLYSKAKESKYRQITYGSLIGNLFLGICPVVNAIYFYGEIIGDWYDSFLEFFDKPVISR